MPFTQGEDGARIHYEVAGRADGEPLLLIQGLGADLKGWAAQRYALGRRYRLLLVDNRGAGGSDKPDGPYDLEVMATDAVAVLDAEGVDRVHVMGASMGGVIAQIIAVRHPHRVRSLVLACTACHHHDWRVELLESWAVLAEERGTRALAGEAIRWLVGPRHHVRFRLPFGLLGPLVLNLPAHAFAAQARAITAMSDEVREELHFVDAPTLVIVGTQDILTPLPDSEELAELIPGAELSVIPSAAHGLMLEAANAFNDRVLDFLARVQDVSAAA
jgi:pimeloyl-ACP methyl ester carboxylesterase